MTVSPPQINASLACLTMLTAVVERNDAFQVPSEEIYSPTVKRAALPDVSPTNICIHNAEGLVECSDVMIKRGNIAVPHEDTPEKRGQKLRGMFGINFYLWVLLELLTAGRLLRRQG